MSEPLRARPPLRLVRKDEVVPQVPKAPTLDDVEIVAAVRRSDPSAAVAFHDRTRRHVDRTILRLLGRRTQDHDDLAQTAMIELVKSLAGFRGECSLDTWTSRVTAHTVFKELRRRKLERATFVDDLDAIDAASVNDDPASARSSLARVRVHLQALDPLKAWTVLLHDVAGYDLREIAEITEVSVTAAQSRLVRGRRELHERIQADPDLAEMLELRRPR